MTEEILVNFSPTETRAAVVENGVLQDVYIERARSKGYVGNIYKGKVIRVLPGMQAAFVDIGLERAGFIHAADVLPVKNGIEEKPSSDTDVRQLLHEGQHVLVQVIKDPIGTKGARLTTHLSVSARYLVYMPNTNHIGISNRIDSSEEGERLKSLVESLACEHRDQFNIGGFIVRTVAEGVSEEELRADIPFVFRLWADMEETIKTTKTPGIVYEDMPLYMRTIRDLIRPNIEKVRIDSRECFAKMEKFAKHYAPEIQGRIEHYPGERPLFELYGVEAEIQKALKSNVQLKSGGYLIVEQTEAMSTIDVNTGAFVGHRNLEETIFKTNLEAAAAIARQLRVRNLGGIIILDFIDMKDEEHQRQVLRTLEKCLDKDHSKTTITGVSELGLVEMTRKRTRESLGRVMCEPCPVCEGRGKLKSAETVCYDIFREILREARAYEAQKLIVLASQIVVDRLIDEESDNVADLEIFIGRPIHIQIESLYQQEQYDIVLA